MKTYSAAEAANLLGVKRTQIEHWVRSRVVYPSLVNPKSLEGMSYQVRASRRIAVGERNSRHFDFLNLLQMAVAREMGASGALVADIASYTARMEETGIWSELYQRVHNFDPATAPAALMFSTKHDRGRVSECVRLSGPLLVDAPQLSSYFGTAKPIQMIALNIEALYRDLRDRTRDDLSDPEFEEMEAALESVSRSPTEAER